MPPPKPTPTIKKEKKIWLLGLFNKRSSLIALCWLIIAYFSIFNGHQQLVQNERHQIIVHHHENLIEAQIIHNLPVYGIHADGTDIDYRCTVGEKIYLSKRYRLWGGLNGTRQPLQHPLNASGVLDFAIHISDMKLRILIVGNSLGEQLFSGLEEAMCFPPMNNYMNDATTTPLDRKRTTIDQREQLTKWAKQASTCQTKFVENYGVWDREPRIVTTQSDGTFACIKDNIHMIDTNTRWNLENAAVSSVVQAFTELHANNNSNKNRYTDGQLLDVFIYQFQSGHVDLHDFDEYYLEQAILAASDLFGATTVIFPTIAWMNNVNRTNVDKLHKVNDRIRNFVKMYASTSKSKASRVESVFVLDIAQLSTAYIEANAKILNIPEEKVYTLRLDNLFESLAAHMCASLPFEDDPRGCLPGMASVSGITLIHH